MSSKEPGLSARAERLKFEGATHFKSAEYSLAFIAYTAAIAEEPRSPALYSNRSVTALKMQQYTQALSDAKKAVELDPGWEKAHLRQAVAHEKLGQYRSAASAYERAANLATTPATKSSYEKEAKRNMDKSNSGFTGVPDTVYPPGNTPIDRFVQLTAQGHRFRLDSAAMRQVSAVTTVFSEWKTLQALRVVTTQDDGRPFPPGQTGYRGTLGALARLIRALTLDPLYSFAYMPTDAWPDPFELLTAAMQYEAQACNLPDKLSALQVIEHFDKIQRTQGWDDLPTRRPGARRGLTSYICIFIAQGIMLELGAKDFGSAAEKYSKSLAVIEHGRATWPGKDTSDGAGFTLRPGFLRSIKGRLLECLVGRANDALRVKDAPLAEFVDVERAALEQLESCNSDPIRLVPDADISAVVHWVAFQRIIRAEAYLALAFVHKIRGETKGRGVGEHYLVDYEETFQSIRYYLSAAAWYPLDDRRCCQSFWYALAMVLRSADTSLKDIDDIVALAKVSEEAHGVFFDKDEIIQAFAEDRSKTLKAQTQLVEYAQAKGITDRSKVPMVVVAGMFIPSSENGEIRYSQADPETSYELRDNLNLLKIYEEAKQAVDAELANGPPMTAE